jgi:CRISPR-associated protein Csb1
MSNPPSTLPVNGGATGAPFTITNINNIQRIDITVPLKVTGDPSGRFQPTGFPNLGPALYKGADGHTYLYVESVPSMANRMEQICWDNAKKVKDGKAETDVPLADLADDMVGDYNTDCKNIPYVRSEWTHNGQNVATASPLEAHRIASPYIWTTSFATAFKQALGIDEGELINWPWVAQLLLYVDPGCLLHGLWISSNDRDKKLLGGRIRITRSLEGYILAKDANPVVVGVTKTDHIDSSGGDAGDSSGGFGNIISEKTYYTSPEITAHFCIHINRLRQLGITDSHLSALIQWAVYKIDQMLYSHKPGSIADLRSECCFEVSSNPTITVK